MISDNRITMVAPGNSVTTPDGAHEIDVSGKTIVPGYVDLHMHTRVARGIHNDTVWEYLANLAYGVTTTRDPQTGSTDTFTYSDLVETDEIVGPRAYSTGPGIFGTENIKSYTDALNVLKRYAEYYRVNTIKQYLAGDRTVRQWISMASQETEIIPTSEGHDNKLMMSQVFDGYSLEHNFPYVPLYKDMIEVIAQSGTYYTPTMIIARPGPQAENYYWTQTEVHDDKKLRRFTPHGILDGITRRKRWYHNDEYVYQIHAEPLKKIIEAGGKVCVGSHAETWGIGFHWDLWTIQSGGMSEMDALKTATIFGAEAIGFDEDLGSIHEGKIADMVILNSNPLDDIRNTADVHFVMKNGLLYNGDSLDMLWPDEEKLPETYWNLTDPQ